MSEQPSSDNSPSPKGGTAGRTPRFGRRLLMSASLSVPTLLTLGRVAHSQTQTFTVKKSGKKKGKSMGTASELASIKKHKKG